MRAMTNAMDTIIGKVLDAASKQPNTYVIVIGDNGTPVYPERLGPNLSFIDNMYITRKGRGKGTAFESGARVEFAIRGPGIEPGSTSGEFVHVTDLYNTILDLAHLPQAKTVSNSAGDAKVTSDSISLAPILLGKAKAVRDPVNGVLLTEDQDLMRDNVNVVGARNKDWKLVCATSPDNCAFYNLVDDPLEEYPLPKPGDCDGAPTLAKRDDPRWNYCHLDRAVATESILSPGYKPAEP
jgi:arylsulfatase A-like enzyme